MILICESMDPAGLQCLRDFEVSYQPGLASDRERLLSAAAGARALIVRNKTEVDAELLASAPHLRAVGRLGVGLDNIRTELLSQRGISLVVPRGANADSVAEYVMAAILTAARHIERDSQAVKAGIWRRDVSAFELAGKTLGIIGFGTIGRAVAKRARAFSLLSLAHDPNLAGVDAPEGVRAASLPELLSESDFVTVHVPALPSTHHLLGRGAFELMRPGAYLINTARGSVVDEAALAAALRARKIAGAVLDVREREPPGEDDPLAAFSRVFLTPHVAGLTKEAQERISREVADGVRKALET